MRIVIPVAAALCLGFGFVLQQHAAERAPSRDVLTLRLFLDLFRSGMWIGGIVSMVAGQVLSAVALARDQLVFVEPLLAANLVFALLLGAVLSQQRLTATGFLGAVVLSGGVATFTVAVRAHAETADLSGSLPRWSTAAMIGALALFLMTVGKRQRSARMEASLLGTAAGLIFGIQDALTRRVMASLTAGRLVELLVGWQLYALVAAAVVGLLLMQSAFAIAPLRVSLPPVTAAEPLAGIVLGAVIFGDQLSLQPVALTVELIGLTAMVVGVFVVGRSHLLTPGHHRPHRPHLPHHDRTEGEDGTC